MEAATSKRRIDTADVAKMVRQALKAEFPGVKFSVRSKRYSGGSSIRASWVDGPTPERVDAVLNLYTGATFDGMEDMKNYHDTMLATDDGFEVVHMGVDFVFSDRSLSPEWRAELEAEIAEAAGRPFNGNEDYQDVYVDRDTGEIGKLTANGWIPMQCGYDLLHRAAWKRERFS